MSAEPVTLAGGPYENEMDFSGRCAVSAASLWVVLVYRTLAVSCANVVYGTGPTAGIVLTR